MSDYEDVRVTDLVINNISQEKYDELKAAGQLEATQIYLTPTVGGSGGLTEVTAGEGLEGNGTSDNPLAIDTVFLDTAISASVAVDMVRQEAVFARGEASQALTMAQSNEQALSNKQDTLTEQQLLAINSGITSDKVAAYDGYATNKQTTLTTQQLSAVNSGITSGKVQTYDNYATNKQNTLTGAQLTAINSGITVGKVSTYDSYAAQIAGKQSALTSQQLTAVNSGITAALVQRYNNYATQIADKQDKGDYVTASTEGTGGQLLSILLCSNEAEALELSGTHAGSLCFFPAVTE